VSPWSRRAGSSAGHPVEESVDLADAAVVDGDHVETDRQRFFGTWRAEVPGEPGGVVVAVGFAGQAEGETGELRPGPGDELVDAVPAVYLAERVGVVRAFGEQFADQRTALNRVVLVPHGDVGLGGALDVGHAAPRSLNWVISIPAVRQPGNRCSPTTMALGVWPVDYVKGNGGSRAGPVASRS
jgi:hypothetical protein